MDDETRARRAVLDIRGLLISVSVLLAVCAFLLWRILNVLEG